MIITDHPDDEADYYYCDYCEKYFDESKFDFALHQQLDCEETFCNEECAIDFSKQRAEKSHADDMAFYIENDLLGD